MPIIWLIKWQIVNCFVIPMTIINIHTPVDDALVINHLWSLYDSWTLNFFDIFKWLPVLTHVLPFSLYHYRIYTGLKPKRCLLWYRQVFFLDENFGRMLYCMLYWSMLLKKTFDFMGAFLGGLLVFYRFIDQIALIIMIMDLSGQIWT